AEGRTLIATSRFNRASRARYTSPMPPEPMAARISYGPRRAPGARLMLSRRHRRRRDRIEPFLQPRVHFLVEVTAVLAVQNPVIRPRPHQQAARHLHPLQRAPVLEGVVD